MKTTCSNVLSKLYRPIYSSTLWLFPAPLQERLPGRVVDVAFTVSIASSSAVATLKQAISTWNVNDSCMPVDITRVVMKYGVKGVGSDDQECTLTVTISDVTAATEESSPALNPGTCSIFNDRGCSTPFLFSAHFNERNNVDPIENEDRLISKRSLAGVNDTSSYCRKTDMTIVLSEIIDNILYPLEVNIGACEGTCELDQPESLRHSLFNHFSLSHTHTPCCAVDDLTDWVILLREGDVYILDVLSDMVVGTCKCTI